MKIVNGYVREVREIYTVIPKAVWCALAVSFAQRTLESGIDSFEGIQDALIEEWRILHQNGIVPQSPPQSGRRRGALAGKEDRS